MCLNWMATASQMRVGAYYYIMPYQNQARRVVWLGMDGSGKKFLDAFPPELVAHKSEAEMRLVLKNGSIFQVVGGDDPDKLVGANPVGVVFSEYALTDPNCWKLVAPILNENQGWAVFNSTPRGENHFYDLVQEAKHRKDWYWSHETARSLKVLTPDQLREMRHDLGDDALFMQEAFCSFTAPMQGAYYQSQMRTLMKAGRIGRVPVEPSLPVFTAWDLGVADATAIWFLQEYRNELRGVGYYENSGEPINHYVQYTKTWGDTNNVVYSRHYAPHDVVAKELGTGKSVQETAQSFGLRFNVAPKLSVYDGIDAVRRILPQFWMDAENCKRGIECLRNYRKEWDPTRQVFKDQPLHDWSSHGADALRTFAVAHRFHKGREKEALPSHSDNDYDPFTH
jgi:hypothetical protein